MGSLWSWEARVTQCLEVQPTTPPRLQMHQSWTRNSAPPLLPPQSSRLGRGTRLSMRTPPRLCLLLQPTVPSPATARSPRLSGGRAPLALCAAPGLSNAMVAHLKEPGSKIRPSSAGTSTSSAWLATAIAVPGYSREAEREGVPRAQQSHLPVNEQL